MTDEWIKKMQYIHTTGYYMVTKKREKLTTFAATWMDLEIIILSEVIQRKTISYAITLCGI